ncbi:MAG: BTAD domain-containing putative transcriptional regulator [Candidatus Promineifilaceae bacterium]
METVNGELRIEMLGPLRVTAGGETAVFRTDAQRVLLAYLAAHQGQPQRRDTLAALLAPDRTDKEALTYLRNRLTRLRKAIGDDTAVPPYLHIDRKQLTLRGGDDVVVDLTQFDELVTAVSTHPHRQLAGCPTCMARLEMAVALIRGELLAGLNFPSETWQTWLTAQREHRHQRALEAMDWLREAKATQGEWTAVPHIAQRQLQLEPWHEAAHRALMQAHARLGDRPAALAQYDQCAQILWDELAVEPDEETATLWEKIKVAGADVIREPLTMPTNLPPPTTRFVGREAEQARLLHRLADPHYRLVTLVGTGGMGKTRLAVEVGRQMVLNFPDGVWFVPLDAVQPEAEAIQRAVGEAMGLAEGDKPLTGTQVLALLRDKQALLILDNCETALDGLDFLPEWLRRAPHIAVLATSREPLNFQAESVVALAGLPLGDGTGTAETLFVERAQMARADFAITAENWPHIRRICELVDGSPLGIALAAAWVRRRSLAQIADGIGQSLDLLSTRLRDVDPRHRNMRAVFEASWRLLAPGEQAVLAALSVFPAPFAAEAAAQVAGADLLTLDGLCEKSLLVQQPEQERYAWHTLVRRFAAEKLGEGETAVTQTYIAYYHHFAQTHCHHYAALQPEWPHLMTAVVRAHGQQQWAQVVDLVQTLDEAWFRQIRFHDMRQGLALAVEAASHLPDRSALARLQLRLAEIEIELNGYETAEAQLVAVMPLLARLEDGWGIAQGNYLYGRIKLEQAQDAEALKWLTEARRIFEDEGDALGAARALNLMASCHMKVNPDYETAAALLQEAIARLRPLPPSAPYVEALRYLSRVKCKSGHYAEAEPALAEAAKVSEALQDMGECAAVLYEQMVLYKRLGQVETALRFGYESLPLFQKLGSLRWQGLIKTQLGVLHQTEGQLAQAATLYHEALQIFIEVGDLFEQAYTYYYMYKLYAAMGEPALSLEARQEAERLNQSLQIPYLTAQFGRGRS